MILKPFAAFPSRLAAAAAIGATLLLAGCGSGGWLQETADSPLGQFFRGTSEPPKTLAPELMSPVVKCPPVTMRDGTQTFAVYDGGREGDAMSLRYQGTIADTARECSFSGGQLSLKVGVAGRVLTGPKGGPGSITMPVRITVADSHDQTLYSKLFQVKQAIPGTDAVGWVLVQDQIVVPARDDLVIFVGFDDGGAAKKRRAALKAAQDAPLDAGGGSDGGGAADAPLDP
ncbi:hypothetical protein SAMN02745172_00162 [Pseudoxanthobacter soli DSM 19599]|uniref:Lipoprotein n=1 Tax=Pseudoxanthobacter soli DSM 19599 TaxID=1123029 RepID=A0A1M7Z5B2_9HYPH|nr:hypothetical protein [Pseudoxanthobacter soli]SHO60059.1 hypothetical protein SAMN02745172_00162 [Pseudoxanthobacter soli DSM 19599]